MARPPVVQSTSKDQSSSELIDDSGGSNPTMSPTTPRKKSRHHNSSKKHPKVKIASSYRGVIPTTCVLQRVQLNQNGRIFVTEDLYGMDRNPGNNENNADNGNDEDGGQLIDNDSPDCVICMTDPKEVAVYPCRHMCMCLTCAEALPSQNNKCPMCRRPAVLLLRSVRIYSLLNIIRLRVYENSSPSDAVNKEPEKEESEAVLTKSKNPSALV